MTPEQRAAVVAESLTWLRTPYHHAADIKGQGVDCLMLLIRVFHACALVPAIDPRPYPAQWHLHRSDEVYLAGLEKYATELPPHEAPQAGDIALWKFGRTYSHAAILINEREVVHAFKDAREVTIADRWSEPLAARDVKYFTLTAAPT